MKPGIGVRHLQVLMASLVMMIAFMLRVNLSIAIVAMTDGMKKTDAPVYEWKEAEKSAVLSSLFWGLPWLQIISGNMAEKYGSKLVLFLATVTLSSLVVLTPCAAKFGYQMVCVLRALQGVAQGAYFPSIMVLLSKWIPSSDRVGAVSLAYSGGHIGTLLAFPLSGYLASTHFGWPAIFYCTGGLGFAWVLLWLWVGASTPGQQSFISHEEVSYIQSSLIDTNIETEKKSLTPWKDIMKSAPVWAIIASHCGQNWGYYTLLTETPNYINAVSGVDIRKNGVLSAMPYVCGWITIILFTWILHKMQKRRFFSKTKQRKIWNSIGLGGGALTLLILGVSNTKNASVIVPLLIVTLSINSAVYNGFLTNHVDVSPNFCGTLMGISNTIGHVASVIGTLSVGLIVNDPSSELQWKYVFFLASAVMFGTNLIYVFFASSKVQRWNDSQMTQDNENE